MNSDDHINHYHHPCQPHYHYRHQNCSNWEKAGGRESALQFSCRQFLGGNWEIPLLGIRECELPWGEQRGAAGTGTISGCGSLVYSIVLSNSKILGALKRVVIFQFDNKIPHLKKCEVQAKPRSHPGLNLLSVGYWSYQWKWEVGLRWSFSSSHAPPVSQFHRALSCWVALISLKTPTGYNLPCLHPAMLCLQQTLASLSKNAKWLRPMNSF